MKTRRDHSNWVIKLAGILLCLTLFSMHLTSGLYARYTTSSGSGDEARVAAFGFYVKDGETTEYIQLEQIRLPGDSQTVALNVSNGSGTRVAEVDVTYEMTLTVDGSMPLVCSVQKNAETAVSMDRFTVAEVKRTFVGTFDAAVSGTDTYTLTVTWPETNGEGVYYNDAAQYASGSAVAEVAVSIVAEQAD